MCFFTFCYFFETTWNFCPLNYIKIYRKSPLNDTDNNTYLIKIVQAITHFFMWVWGISHFAETKTGKTAGRCNGFISPLTKRILNSSPFKHKTNSNYHCQYSKIYRPGRKTLEFPSLTLQNLS